MSASTVMRPGEAQGTEAAHLRGFGISRDPKFVGKLEDIAGLYMAPPEHALVVLQ